MIEDKSFDLENKVVSLLKDNANRQNKKKL